MGLDNELQPIHHPFHDAARKKHLEEGLIDGWMDRWMGDFNRTSAMSLN